MLETIVQEKVYPWVRAKDIVQNGKVRTDFQVVDFRTLAEFGEVHVPGAINIPVADISSSLTDLGAKGENMPIVLMCRTQNRAKLVYDQLPKPNHCHILEGGIDAWKAAGYPVVQGQRAIFLEGQVRMLAGALIVLGTILGVAVNSWFFLIPAGVGAGLFHAGYTNSCLMGMILAKLPFNRVQGRVSRH